VFDVDAALVYMVESGGSDLHLKVPSPPLTRLHGALTPIPEQESLTPEDTAGVLDYVLRDHEDKREEFAASGECDFAYALDGVARFRVNSFRQRGSVSLVFRAIAYDIKTIDELMLPPSIKKLGEEERGIVLVTGTTGSGKSTTLAAMIRHINDTMAKHIITLEDPIEYLHRDNKSIVQQREVGEDTESFTRALRRILRQDPDAILIGEMRDEETVETALSAAETGHLVFSTLHTLNATETINRIIDFFPLHQNQQVRVMLAGVLRGIISQRLVRTKDGKGRVPICEVLISTGRVKDMIVDPEQTSKIQEVIADGAYYGMQTFDQALLVHLKAGNISMEEAMHAATSPHDFKLMVAADGKGSSSMDMLDEKKSDKPAGGQHGQTPVDPRAGQVAQAPSPAMAPPPAPPATPAQAPPPAAPAAAPAAPAQAPPPPPQAP
jgi:twitching motility protein PilT